MRTNRLMRKQSPKAKLREDAWWAIRRRVFARDKYQCVAHIKGICTRAAEQCHHLVLKSAGGTDEESNLITTCLACHDWIHLHKPEAYDLGLIHSPKQEAQSWLTSNATTKDLCSPTIAKRTTDSPT